MADTKSFIRVLLVDDDRETLVASARLLSAEGFEVTAAGGMVEALSACDGGRSYDVLVSDMELCDGFGLDLLGEVRKRCGQRIRGIMVTGLQCDDHRAMVREAGYEALLLKPVDGARLVGAVRGVMDVPQARMSAEEWVAGSAGEVL